MLDAYVFAVLPLTFLLTLGMGWLSIRIAHKLNLIDQPGSAPHKQHRAPKPLAGGIALALTLSAGLLASGLWREPEVRAIFFPALIVFGIGLWDDARGFSATVKFSAQILATVLLMISGIYIQVFSSFSFSTGWPEWLRSGLNYGLTLLWVTGITNALNLVDSMDGLAVGLGGLAFGFFTLVTIDSQQWFIAHLNALIVGVCLGLYFLNVSPARLFLGDSGTQTLGFILAAVAILYEPPATDQASSWFVPILLLGVPIFDTMLVLFSRLRHGRHFYKGGLDHTYHRLVAWGLDANRAVLIMQIAALLLGCAAFVALSLSPLPANMIFLGCLLTGFILMIIMDRGKGTPTA